MLTGHSYASYKLSTVQEHHLLIVLNLLPSNFFGQPPSSHIMSQREKVLFTSATTCIILYTSAIYPGLSGGGGGEALEESWYKVPGPGGGARTGGRKSGGSLGQVQCRHSNQAVVFSRPHSPTLHQLLLPLPFLPGWACATTLTHLPRAWHGRLMAPEGSRWRQRRAVATMQAANEKACHFLRLLFQESVGGPENMLLRIHPGSQQLCIYLLSLFLN